MMWKLFAATMAVCFGFGLTFQPRDILDIAAIPIQTVASVGLLAYAFRLRRAHTQLWAPFAWFFAAWSLMTVVVGAIRNSTGQSPVYAIVGASLIGAALLYFNWLALYRLGRAEHA